MSLFRHIQGQFEGIETGRNDRRDADWAEGSMMGEHESRKGSNPMLTKVIKWSAIAALIGSALSRSLPDIRLTLLLAVAAAAVIVLTQAAIMHRYIWMSLFVLVAGLFNPVFPIPFSIYISGVVTMIAGLLFFFSLELLQPATQVVDSRDHGSRARSESL